MKPGEKGYTLIELLIAITIMVMASGAAGAGIFQVWRNTERNRDHMTAVRQVQNAGYWISRDAQMAQSVTTEPDFLIVNWTEYETGNQYQVTYTLADMAEGQLKKLLRNQSIDGGASITTLVAQYIDSDPENTSCNLTSGIVILIITATAGDGSLVESETRTYKVIPRSG